MSSETPQAALPLDEPPVNRLNRRVVRGFWRRIFAFLTDVLVTAVPCAFIGFTFYGFFAQSKLAGDLLGFFITLPYFAVLGSSVGRGQTLGQRIARIQIVDREGRYLSLERSFLRYLILLTPFQLTEAETPVGAPADLKMLVSWLFPALVVVIGYLYLFNVQTRQSLHDLAVGAYVVDARAEGPVEIERFWKWHWAILSGVLFAGAVLTIAITGGMVKRGLYRELLTIQRAVLDSGKVRATSLSFSRKTTKGQSASELRVNVNWNGRPGNYDLASTEIAAIVLKADPEASKLDYIGVGFTEGLKVGFVNFSRNWVVRRPPSDWTTKIQQLHSG